MADRVKPEVTGLTRSGTENAARALCAGSGGKDGARGLRRRVQEQVEGPLAVFMLQCAKKPGKIKGRWVDGRLQFQC